MATMGSYKSRFGEMLKDARTRADQTADVMAILLNLDPESYAAMEAGARFPDDDTLRRLCMMLEWNYQESARLIRNEMASTTRASAVAPAGEGALQGHPLNPDGTPGTAKAETLGERLKEVRLLTGQSVEIIAALLNVPAQTYLGLEEGDAPSDELLRRISMVYSWNFYDLQAILRSEQAHQLQPHRVGSPFPNSSHRGERVRGVLREIEAVFLAAPEPEQEMMLAQLELIRATLQRHHKTGPAAQSSAPAPAMATPGPAPMAPTTHRRKSSLNPVLPGIGDRKIFPA